MYYQQGWDEVPILLLQYTLWHSVYLSTWELKMQSIHTWTQILGKYQFIFKYWGVQQESIYLINQLRCDVAKHVICGSSNWSKVSPIDP